MEAVRQTVAARNRKISGFQLKNVQLLAPLRVGSTIADAVETDVHLDRIEGGDEKESTWFRFRLFSHNEGRVTQTCDAQIQVIFEEGDSTPASYERMMENEGIRKRADEIRSRCTEPLDTRTFYKRFLKYGFQYGQSFTVASDARFDPIGKMSGTGKVSWNAAHVEADDSPVHPGILDGILQVLLATAPKGLKNTSTWIPRRIGRVWVSNRIWRQYTKTVNVASNVNVEDGVPLMNFWALSDDDTPLCTIESVKCAEISRTNKLGGDPVQKKLLYSIAWKPRLSSLAPGELQKICDSTSIRLDNFDSEANAMAKFFPKMESALRLAAKVSLQTMSDSQIGGLPSHFSKYVNLLRLQSTYEPVSAQGEEKLNDLTASDVEVILQECEAEYPQWFLFPAIARALPSILRGETDPLELMFATKAAETFYANVYSSHMLCGGLQTFLGLASHENPRLRILEVGAGTGSFTRHILSTLQAFEQERGGTSFAEYVFTDISTSFFGNAQELFKENLDRMSFKTWNIEHDAADEQSGLDTGAYDIIFAGSVLHVTSDISKALCHLRKLLKPGGYLVLEEITSTQSSCVNIAFGTLPGWWLSTEKWRQGGPLATQESWNQLLQNNGFSGIDLALKDFEDDAHHISSIMVARARGESDPPLQNGSISVLPAQPQIVIIRDQNSSRQVTLTEELGKHLGVTQVVDFDSLGQWWDTLSIEVIVSLVDVETSCLANLGEQGFESLQGLVQGSKNILWVAASTPDTSGLDNGASSLPWDPRSGIATGALRTIRSEEGDKHIVNLTITQAHVYEPKELAGFVTEVIDSCFTGDQSRNSPEVEFIVQDGYISVGRMVYEKELDDERESHIQPQRQVEKWDSGPPLVLCIEMPGMLDSLRYVEDTSAYDDLADDEVEIEAEAWPVSFRDIFIALGKVSDRKEFGWECAGKVTRIGPACADQFKLGDRVVMGAFGSMRSRPRAKMQVVWKIPDGLSYLDVVSHVNPAMTAWYGLVNIARLQRGDKVLIHSAAGATGQMAVGIAKMAGAE
jgi:SAM-dependent methyltransferase